jgi:hypothetical protein
MLFTQKRDIKRQRSRRELVVPWPVFLECLEEVLIVLAKVLSETCAEEEECLHPPRPIEDGIVKSTRTRDDMLLSPLWLDLLLPHS